MSHQLDAIAAVIFTVALRDHQAGELLECLFDGGTATVDRITGRLVMLPGNLLQQMTDDS